MRGLVILRADHFRKIRMDHNGERPVPCFVFLGDTQPELHDQGVLFDMVAALNEVE
jgi:hypothetical protein